MRISVLSVPMMLVFVTLVLVVLVFMMVVSAPLSVVGSVLLW